MSDTTTSPVRPLKQCKFKESASVRRDGERVQDGLTGYLKVANALAYRYYRYQLPTPEDRQQAAALAALEALKSYEEHGTTGTLGEVTKLIRRYLYRQARAYGYRMVNLRRADGHRTSQWILGEITFSQLAPTHSHPSDFETLHNREGATL